MFDRLKYKLRELKWLIKDYFKRPNRIEPRYLSYSFVDKADLLPHVMFETFCQFYEKEVLNMTPDWCINFAAHKIEFGGHERGVDEVFEWLYNWWAFYQKQTSYDCAYFRNIRENVEFGTEETQNPHMLLMTVKYKDEAAHQKLRLRHSKKEIAQLKMLEDNLIALVRLRNFLWT